MNELETKLITIYCKVCEAWEQGVFVSAQRFSNNQKNAWSDQEITTMYIFAVLEGRQTKKEIFEYLRNHWRAWFPDMKGYPAFCYRLNVLEDAFVGLVEWITSSFDAEFGYEARKLIDAMPILMAKAKRSNRAKVAGEFANKGYCASKGEYYYGVKLHVIAHDQDGAIPIPSFIGLAPASSHDLQVFRQVSGELSGCDLFADNAYTDKSLHSSLLGHQDVFLTTPIKKQKGQKKLDSADRMYSTAVSSIRQPIESLFNWLEQKVKIQVASKVRSTKGLKVHVFGKIAAGLMSLMLAQ